VDVAGELASSARTPHGLSAVVEQESVALL